MVYLLQLHINPFSEWHLAGAFVSYGHFFSKTFSMLNSGEHEILIAILCNHFTFYIGGSARVVSDFFQTFSVCVLSHKNM